MTGTEWRTGSWWEGGVAGGERCVSCGVSRRGGGGGAATLNNHDVSQQPYSHKHTHSDTQGVVQCHGRIPFNSELPLARNCCFLFLSVPVTSPATTWFLIWPNCTFLRSNRPDPKLIFKLWKKCIRIVDFFFPWFIILESQGLIVKFLFKMIVGIPKMWDYPGAPPWQTLLVLDGLWM